MHWVRSAGQCGQSPVAHSPQGPGVTQPCLGHVGHAVPARCQPSSEEAARGLHPPTHRTATRSSPAGMVPCTLRELPPLQASCRQQLVLSLPSRSG